MPCLPQEAGVCAIWATSSSCSNHTEELDGSRAPRSTQGTTRAAQVRQRMLSRSKVPPSPPAPAPGSTSGPRSFRRASVRHGGPTRVEKALAICCAVLGARAIEAIGGRGPLALSRRRRQRRAVRRVVGLHEQHPLASGSGKVAREEVHVREPRAELVGGRGVHRLQPVGVKLGRRKRLRVHLRADRPPVLVRPTVLLAVLAAQAHHRAARRVQRGVSQQLRAQGDCVRHSRYSARILVAQPSAPPG